MAPQELGWQGPGTQRNQAAFLSILASRGHMCISRNSQLSGLPGV